MEAKKSAEADLEKRKKGFTVIGLVAALAIVLVAMEWTVFDRTISELGGLNMEFLEEEVIPPSATPPPPPPPPPTPSTVLEIVEDDEDVEETIQMDEEPDEKTEVAPPPPPAEEETDEIFTIVEDMPSFPGGETALFKFLANQIKYPQMAVDAGISGTVYVNFVVDKDGKVKNAKIARGIHAACDKEALRVVNSMPPWKAGKQRGKPVKVSYNLPIKFTLQ